MITLTMKSANAKLTGDIQHPAYSGHPIASTSRAIGAGGEGTCPSSCSLLGNGCYAAGGPQGIIQRRSGYATNDGERLKTFLSDLPRRHVVRHHVSGDIGANDGVDWEYVKAMVDGHAENPQIVGFGYTHFWRDLPADSFDGPGQLTMNASAENHQQVKEALAAGWPVVSVVPSTESRRTWREDGVRYVTCPQVTTGLGCRDCLLCARTDRNFVVAFPAHGASKKRVDAHLENLTPLAMASD